MIDSIFILFNFCLGSINDSFYFSQANLMSEVTCRCSVLHCIVYLDKSHHTKSSTNNKDRTRITSLTNHFLPQSGLFVFKNLGNFTTRVFGWNLLEPMPPIFIFKTRAKNEVDIKIQLQRIDNAPIVKRTWGIKHKCAMDTHVAIQRNGWMGKDLFIQQSSLQVVVP